MSQHDKMKELYETHTGNKERVVAEYARRLWNDGTGSGRGKGWLLAS